jgi:soluble lytic murein transglycosylase-like protein
MSLTDLYAKGIDADIERRLLSARSAPAAGPDFKTTSFLAAGMNGVQRGAAELAASFMDASAAAGEDPSEKRRRDAAGIPQAATGDEIRARSADLVPDAATAHAADQMLFGFTRLGSKIAAASVAAGPAGALGAAGLVGAEETNTAARELMAKGVDRATAMQAGAVQGVGAAAALVPFAGPTIKATAALAAAAGPGVFMAQEAASRKILERAGYADEASKHDPLDPLGLTIATLLPAVFGGAHAVGLARTAKAPPTLSSVVESLESGGKRYGADGQLLTSPKGAQGEMQVMPATAKWTAKKIGLNDFKPHQITERDTNIAIGTGYLKLVLDSFEGSMPLAAAAYNAGPSRSRNWRGQDGSPTLEAAIWAENVPFNETRDYVKKVLANTTNYAALLSGKPQSLKARLGTIGPQGQAKFVDEDLP